MAAITWAQATGTWAEQTGSWSGEFTDTDSNASSAEVVALALSDSGSATGSAAQSLALSATDTGVGSEPAAAVAFAVLDSSATTSDIGSVASDSTISGSDAGAGSSTQSLVVSILTQNLEGSVTAETAAISAVPPHGGGFWLGEIPFGPGFSGPYPIYPRPGVTLVDASDAAIAGESATVDDLSLVHVSGTDTGAGLDTGSVVAHQAQSIVSYVQPSGTTRTAIGYTNDGINWVSVPSDWDNTAGYNDSSPSILVYANGAWYLGGGTVPPALQAGGSVNQRDLYVSNDGGATWTWVHFPADGGHGYIQGMGCSGPLWVIYTNEPAIYTSTDMVSFTRHPFSLTGFIEFIKYLNGTWFMGFGGGTTGGHVLATSPDGFTWAYVTTPIDGSGAWAGAIDYAGGKYVLGGGGITGHKALATSTDGVTWTAITTALDSANDGAVQDLFYDTIADLWVVMGTTDQTNWTNMEVFTSPDLTTWVTHAIPMPSNAFHIVRAGGMYLLNGTTNDNVHTFARSTDLNSWTLDTTPFDSPPGNMGQIAGYLLP